MGRLTAVTFKDPNPNSGNAMFVLSVQLQHGGAGDGAAHGLQCGRAGAGRDLHLGY